MSMFANEFWGRAFIRLAGACIFAISIGFAHCAMAQTLTNGSFAVTGGSQSYQFTTGYTPTGTAVGESMAGWTTSSFALVYTSPSATVAANNNNCNCAIALYSVTAPPLGGNFIAEDTDPGAPSAINTTVGGLVQGKSYTLSFYWAGAQQTGYTGTSSEKWTVTLGGAPSQSTVLITDPSGGFTGWQHATMTFVASASGSQTLGFLAAGSQSVPPFALLADVSLVATPEPTSAALLVVGIGGLIGMARLRRASAGRAAAV